MFDHVQIKVGSLAASRRFFDGVMATLGHGVVLEVPGVVIGYGPSAHNMFEIRQEDDDAPLSRAVHVAFSAPSREAVRAFYKAAMATGGTDNGKPGMRPHYEDGYFAAFVLDPDGNNIEVVCSVRTTK